MLTFWNNRKEENEKTFICSKWLVKPYKTENITLTFCSLIFVIPKSSLKSHFAHLFKFYHKLSVAHCILLSITFEHKVNKKMRTD